MQVVLTNFVSRSIKLNFATMIPIARRLIAVSGTLVREKQLTKIQETANSTRDAPEATAPSPTASSFVATRETVPTETVL